MPPVFRNDSPEVALIQQDPPRPIEASDLWALHRALLGNPKLSTRLDDCPWAAQRGLYGLAVLIAKLRRTAEPLMPEGMSGSEATRIVDLVDEHIRALSTEPVTRRQ